MMPFNPNIKKIPRFCRVDKLDSWYNQVGAISESLGFPVLPGHAHPFPGTAPFNFFSRGTSYINHAQSRGLFSSSFINYIIYTRIIKKWQGEK
jgi:hypothetical protein